MAHAYLQIDRVSKRFDRTVALDDVTLEIGEGEFVFLLGPSGCGKTTLLRIIAGLEEPTSGRVIQAGQDVTRLPPSRRNFGIVFQSYALFPNLTVFQNVAYGLENRREPRAKIRARVAEMLELVGLSEYASRYPAQLSGGQQQRVALARALAISPGLLLLDEPLSALDARVRANLRIEIARLQRQLGITTVMVSHDQEEALTMADRVVVMERGRIVQVGEPEVIYHQPATPFVADFVGLMNFLPAVACGDHRVRFQDTDLELDHGLDQPAGQPVTLAIRPEQVQVARNGQAVNVLRARVEEIEFIGPFYRLHLRLGQEAPIIAYMPPEHSSEASISAGMTIPVELPPRHLRVYPASS
ncbi:MAG: putative 2-aminoethylphosphonate ABC transporter ATP-binding protein [Oscillochloridaceae bacterium]|nr:putative 2-aminoethylphosphonate ABC transporter ATP-binding protein [Chloroflexaceae bacterium]MDW8389005.1 putative 2-aminoethylphosphonate ABC transporter ATP-binding protein [Oscillochloridaceae bacterium]